MSPFDKMSVPGIVSLARHSATLLSLEQVARLAITIYEAHEVGAELDAGFDGGEWSGPAHGDMADEQVADLARANGFTLETVLGEIQTLQAADEGPHGRNF